MTVSWGLPVFAVAMAGTGAAAVVSGLLFRTRDDDALATVTGPRPVVAAAQAVAAGGVAPGAKPVLAPLGPAIPKPADAPAVLAAPVSPYAPKPAVVPEPAKPAPEPPRPAPAPVSPYAPRPSVAVQPAQQAQAQANPPTGPTSAAQLAKKTSPMCPTCRVATLWHGKRGAWWCSTCKQTV